jgi:hypothetical protein
MAMSMTSRAARGTGYRWAHRLCKGVLTAQLEHPHA